MAKRISETPGYNSWSNMRSRCNNPNNQDYSQYGGRGITCCDRWKRFANFLEDMGERPEGLTIDRIDVNGNYEPSNCCWATPKEQNSNKRWPLRRTKSKTPYISHHSGGWYYLKITITKGKVFRKYFNSLEKAEALRDICVFERDFLRLRGLSYD